MSVDTVKPPLTLQVEPDRVLFGPYRIPIRFPISVQIKGESHEVRLGCILGAMGLERSVNLDFQLESRDRIDQFAAELLRKSRVYVVLGSQVGPVHKPRYHCYKIAPDWVKKRVAGGSPFCEWVSLKVNAEGAKKRAAELEAGLFEIIDQYPAIKERYQPMMDLISPMAAVGGRWDEVDMEVFRNRIRIFPDPDISDLDEETQQRVHEMFDQLFRKFSLNTPTGRL